jgi:valyl-tRNA synthetase
VDFDIGSVTACLRQRYGLDATMNDEAGPYKGMDREECRRAIVRDLEEQGYLVKTEPYVHSVGHCYRCDSVVEPLVSLQWFVRMEPLARPAIEASKDGRIRFVPERFTKVYLNWMENIRDWCVSRQLWWGHRIPVWYCADCGRQTLAALPGDGDPLADPDHCQHCQSSRIEQDPDTLDTWFSSALWPHSTLGWPDETEDLRYFYPTSVMQMGYEILFFWVARMIVTGLYNMGQVPFRTVYVHGLVRDDQGRKMSKTVGNVLDPVQVIEHYGTDALRYALATAALRQRHEAHRPEAGGGATANKSERLPFRAHEPRWHHGRAPFARPARGHAPGGPLDHVAIAAGDRQRQPAPGAPRAGGGGPAAPRLPLGRVLRLVRGDGEGATQRGTGNWEPGTRNREHETGFYC